MRPLHSGRDVEERHCGEQVLAALLRIEPGEELHRLLLVAGIAADRRQRIGGERGIAVDGEAAGDVLDVRIEPAVLVDDDDAGPGARAFRRTREIAAHLSRSLRRWIVQVSGVDARIVLLHLLGERVVRAQTLQHRGCRESADGVSGRPVEELAPREHAVDVAVEELQDFLGEITRLSAFHRVPPSPVRMPAPAARTSDVAARHRGSR